MSSRHAEENSDVRLGRNLAAAFIAAQQGIGLDYARKKYAGQAVGEYWIALARKISEDMRTRVVVPEPISTIQ